MFTCEMKGCDDMATYEVELPGESFEVCAECANYWSNGADGKTYIISVTKFVGVA